jgi:hypothetical protein
VSVTKASMRADVLDFLNRDDATNAVADTMIQDAYDNLLDDERVRMQSQLVTLQATPDSNGYLSNIPLPSDYLDIYRVDADSALGIDMVDWSSLSDLDPSPGIAQGWSVTAGGLYVRPYPTSSLALIYFSRVPYPANDGDTSGVLQDARLAIKWASLTLLAAYYRMDEVPAWGQAAGDAKETLISREQRRLWPSTGAVAAPQAARAYL